MLSIVPRSLYEYLRIESQREDAGDYQRALRNLAKKGVMLHTFGKEAELDDLMTLSTISLINLETREKDLDAKLSEAVSSNDIVGAYNLLPEYSEIGLTISSTIIKQVESYVNSLPSIKCDGQASSA